MFLRTHRNTKHAAKFYRLNAGLSRTPSQTTLSFSTEGNAQTNKVYVQERAKRNLELDRLAAASGLPWQIQGGMLCSRPPVITPDVEDWVERYFLLQEKRDSAKFSDYEKLLYPRLADSIKYDVEGSQQEAPEDGESSQEATAGSEGELIDSEEQFMKEEIDIEDVLNDEVNLDDYLVVDEAETDNLVEDELEDGGFGPRITEADIANDRTTVNRRLQEYVYLLVKKNDPQTGKAKWFFPYTAKIAGDDTDEQNLDSKRPLKYFAVDSVGDIVGKEVQDDLYVYGNGPSAYYSVEYDDKRKSETGYFGTKIFFYKSQVWGQTEDPPIKLHPDVQEFAWVARDEVEEYLGEEDEEFGKYMAKVLW
eukprot:g3004.t1